MTERERSHARWQWRQLANAAIRGEGEQLEGLAPTATTWRSHIDGKGPSAALFALAMFSLGYLRATKADREAMGPALKALGECAGRFLDASSPIPPPEAPRRHRADLDD